MCLKKETEVKEIFTHALYLMNVKVVAEKMTFNELVEKTILNFDGRKIDINLAHQLILNASLMCFDNSKVYRRIVNLALECLPEFSHYVEPPDLVEVERLARQELNYL